MKKIKGYKFNASDQYIIPALNIEGYINTEGSDILNKVFTYEEHSDSIRRWKDAGVLDLWFEPVYEEEYKVGDWVITENYSEKYDGLALIITVIHRGYYYFHSNHPKYRPDHNFMYKQIKRKATPEEIAKVQEIKMPFGDIEFTIEGKNAKYKDQIWSKGDFRAACTAIEIAERNLENSFGYKSTIKTVKIGCKEGTAQELRDIYNKLNE